MPDIVVTAYYKDGSSKLLTSWNVKFLGYKDPVLGRPVRYETHTVLDAFGLEFLRNSTGRCGVHIPFNSRVTITKDPR